MSSWKSWSRFEGLVTRWQLSTKSTSALVMVLAIDQSVDLDITILNLRGGRSSSDEGLRLVPNAGSNLLGRR